nr:hypothetical protein [Tanacetum cinerariifolium]
MSLKLVDNVKNKAVTGRLKASNNDMHILPPSELMLNQLELGATSTIVVMICRMWDVNSSDGRYLSTDFIVSDNEGLYGSWILELTHGLLIITKVHKNYEVSVTRKQNKQPVMNKEKWGQQIMVTLWGALGHKLIEKRTCHIGLYPIVITVISVKLYNNPFVKDVELDDSNGLELTKEVLPSDNTLPKPRTLENLLMWARNRKYDSATFQYDMKIDKIRTKNGWNFPSRGGEKCKKGNIGHRGAILVVVVLFDETTTSLLKCYASAMVASQAQVRVFTPSNLSDSYTDSQLQDEDENTGLPATLDNIVGTSQTLELKSHTYYEHQNYESFTCWRIVTDDVVEGGSNSNMVAAKAESKAPEVESLNKNPLLSTLYKPTEKKKHRREKLEDFDAKESFVADSQLKGDAVGCSSNTKKKEGLVNTNNLYCISYHFYQLAETPPGVELVINCKISP